MARKWILAVAFPVVFLFVFNNDLSAQQRRNPIQRMGRLLGVGWGNGFHTRTPGTNPDYYNPYSTHNSELFHSSSQSSMSSNGYRSYGNPVSQRATYSLPQEYTRQYQSAGNRGLQNGVVITNNSQSVVENPIRNDDFYYPPRRESISGFSDEAFEIPQAFRSGFRN